MEFENKKDSNKQEPDKKKIDLTFLGPGEFGDTRSTVEAGKALAKGKYPGNPRPIELNTEDDR